MTKLTTAECVRRLFDAWGWKPFAFQRECWRAYLAGESGLVHSATGTGKTLAAWTGPILSWVRDNPDPDKWNAKKPPSVRVIWLTPLRALAGDTENALRQPIERLNLPWRLEGRTGDSKQSVKARQMKVLPTALVTTPESLTLMLTHTHLQESFRSLEAVIVDEWHELLGTKRGAQTELALARLRQLQPKLRTWGVSATLGNLDDALTSLLGTNTSGASRIIRGATKKKMRFESIVPPVIERFPWAGHIGTKMIPQVTERVEQVRSALVFANTRSQTEIWYQQMLKQRPDWAGTIALHHGSLDTSVRTWVENGLRDGSLRAVVCTSSLDLGVDFTAVDLVIQIGSPKGAARLLQRAGRSGHQPDAESRLAFVPTHALELVELAAARDVIRDNLLEAKPLLNVPLDVLVQHVVTLAIGGGFDRDQLLAEVRTARAFEAITDAQWQWVLDFVVKGGDSLTAYPEFRRVTLDDQGRYVVTDKRVMRMHRVNIGTIVSDAAMQVRFLKGGTLGTVEESFVSRLKPGERFLFGGRVVELVIIRDNIAYVKRSKGNPDTVPRWLGGRLPLSSELSRAMRMRLEEAMRGEYRGEEMNSLRPLLELQKRWSALPRRDELLIEQIKNREGYQLFVYPFEGRLAHEGLAALLALRMSRLRPITFTMACNDYGIVLQSQEEPELQKSIEAGLFEPDTVVADILDSLNATEMAKRQFRQIARISGLIHQGLPGDRKPAKHLQASSNLFFDVFRQYDPNNLLLRQSQSEVLEQQLEASRLETALRRICDNLIVTTTPPKITPMGFPLWVDKLRERVSSESLGDRIRKLQEQLERDASSMR